MEIQKRIEWIDVARGIAISFVMVIHSCTSAIRDKSFGVYLLYMFTVTAAVPVLSFLSGTAMALHRERYISMKNQEFIKVKFRRLIIPYISYAVIVYIIFEILSRISLISAFISYAGYGNMSPMHFLLGLLIGDNDYSIHLWFLYALFWNEIVIFIVLKYCKKNYYLIIIAFISIVYLRTLDISNPLPTGWSWGINSLVFYITGVLFGKRHFKTATVIVASVIWILFFALFPINHVWDYDTNHLSRIIIPFMAVIVIPAIAKLSKNRAFEVLEWLGQNSMSLYLFQQPFCGSAFGTILFVGLRLPAFPAVCLCIAASFAIPLLVRHFFGRYMCFNILFGIT